MLAAAAAAAAAAADPLPWFPDIRRQGTKGRETHCACTKIFSVQRRARGRDTFANLKEIDFGTKNSEPLGDGRTRSDREDGTQDMQSILLDYFASARSLVQAIPGGEAK